MLQFSTRTLFAAVAICAVVFALCAYRAWTHGQQRAFVARLSVDDKVSFAGWSGNSWWTLSDVHIVRFVGGKVTDADLTGIDVLYDLRQLRLRDTFVTSAAMKDIRRLAHLEGLNLRGTLVDDTAIPDLIAMTSLKSLDLSHTRVTVEGIDELRRRLDGVEILHFTSSD